MERPRCCQSTPMTGNGYFFVSDKMEETSRRAAPLGN